MAVESYWNNQGPDWFQNKDLETISNALGQQTGPIVMKLLKQYMDSLSPEYKKRMTDQFRQQALENAQQASGVQSAALRAQGFSPGFATGVGINNINAARREGTQFASRQYDPSQALQGALGAYGSLYNMRDPKSQGGSFLGDVFGMAGSLAGMGWNPFAKSAAVPMQSSLGGQPGRFWGQ